MVEPISNAPVEIHSVIFRPDGIVEITYAEKEDLTPEVSLVRTILVSRDKFWNDVQDIEVALFELVDEGLLALRNPPATEPARKG